MGKETSKYSYCQVVGTTDVGCKRSANEDFLGTTETDNGLVAVVCDGMGGHVGGAVASRTAVNAIIEFLRSNYFEDPREAIVEAINAANKAVLYQASIQPNLHGMGSTCVLLLVRDGKVYIGSVGDSRVYLVRNRRITQLTKDQSYVQMLVDLGEITEVQAEKHPRKNEITNAIGLQDMKEATVLSNVIVPMAGDCFVLCSDGLSGMISNHEIEKVVSRQSEMPTAERADLLVQKAKVAGGLDNITVQLVEFSVSPANINSVFNKNKKYTVVFIALVAGLLLSLWGYSKCNQSEYSQVRVKDNKTIKPILATEPRDLLQIFYGKNSTAIQFEHETIWTLPVIHPDSINCFGMDKREGVSGVQDIIRIQRATPLDTLSVQFKTQDTIYTLLIPVIPIIENEKTVEDFPPAEDGTIGSESKPQIKGGSTPSQQQDGTKPNNNLQENPFKNGEQARTDSVENATKEEPEVPIERPAQNNNKGYTLSDLRQA